MKATWNEIRQQILKEIDSGASKETAEYIRKYSSPPERFVRRAKIHPPIPLVRDYNLPKGFKNGKDMQNKLFEKYGIALVNLSDKDMKALRDFLVTLNPELEGLPEGNVKYDYHIILGVASRFIPEDIAYYLSHGSPLLRQDKRYIDMHNKVQDAYGTKFGWFPAPSTLNALMQAVNISS